MVFRIFVRFPSAFLWKAPREEGRKEFIVKGPCGMRAESDGPVLGESEEVMSVYVFLFLFWCVYQSESGADGVTPSLEREGW